MFVASPGTMNVCLYDFDLCYHVHRYLFINIFYVYMHTMCVMLAHAHKNTHMHT